MGTINAQGVYIYDNTDHMIPHATYSNLLGNSVSSALATMRTDFTIADTGWVTVTSAGGMTGDFQGRRIEDQIFLRGISAPGAVWTLNASKTVVSTLAAQFQPASAIHAVATSDAATGDLYFHVTVSGANITARPSRTTTGTSAIAFNLTYMAN